MKDAVTEEEEEGSDMASFCKRGVIAYMTLKVCYKISNDKKGGVRAPKMCIRPRP